MTHYRKDLERQYLTFEKHFYESQRPYTPKSNPTPLLSFIRKVDWIGWVNAFVIVLTIILVLNVIWQS